MKMTIILVLIVSCIVGVGCAPQSVKQSLDMGRSAIVYAKVNNTQPELEKPLDDADILLEPVALNIGKPNTPQIYTPDINAQIIASQAELEQRFRNMIQGFMADLTAQIPVIGNKIAEGIKPPEDEPFDIMNLLAMLSAVIAGIGGSKASGALAKKVVKKKE